MTVLEHPGASAPVVQTPDPLTRCVRLRRRVPSAPAGFVDGGWWPRSRDLAVELPALLAELRSTGQAFSLVLYEPATWDPAPEVVAVAGRTVRLDGSSTRNIGPMITLVDTTGPHRMEVIVVPPHTEPRTARRVLALAELGGDLGHAVRILDRASR